MYWYKYPGAITNPNTIKQFVKASMGVSECYMQVLFFCIITHFFASSFSSSNVDQTSKKTFLDVLRCCVNLRAGEDWILFVMSDALPSTGWTPARSCTGPCPSKPHRHWGAGRDCRAPGHRCCVGCFLPGSHVAANASGSRLVFGCGLTGYFDPFLQDIE